MKLRWVHGDWQISADVMPESEPIIRDIDLSSSTGERWWGFAATTAQINERLHHYSISGECAGGAYFWASGLVVVRDQKDETLKEALIDLIETGDYVTALVRIADKPS